MIDKFAMISGLIGVVVGSVITASIQVWSLSKHEAIPAHPGAATFIAELRTNQAALRSAQEAILARQFGYGERLATLEQKIAGCE